MSALTAVLVGWALLASGFSWVAWFRLRPRPAPAPPPRWPAVLLVRPLEQPTDAELACLAQPIDYRGPLTQWVVGPTRPPLPSRVGWVQSEPRCQNRKVGHLLEVLRAAGDEVSVVVTADADVRVDGALIEALASVVDSGAALAWAAPVPTDAHGLDARAERGLLARTHHSFLALGAMAAGAPTVCGKAMALGPVARTLLPALQDCIGEDLELSQRLATANERVEQVSQVARVAARNSGAVARFTRWMQVLRAHRPALWPSVPLLLAPTPLILLSALALGAQAPHLAAGATVLLLSRTLLAMRLKARAGAEGPAFEWLLGEALLLFAFLRALVQRTVAWRGRRFNVGPGGQMTPAAR